MEPPLWQLAIAVQTDPNIFFHCKGMVLKVWFYIALYPVHWTAQSALHFPPLADLFIPTPFSASLGSILALSTGRYIDNIKKWTRASLEENVRWTEDRTAWRERSCAAGAANVRTDDAD